MNESKDWPPTTETDELQCKLCGGAGYFGRRVPLGHPDFGKAFRCRCNRWIMGIPRGREDDSFDTFSLKANPGMKRSYDRCRAVAEGNAWCAFLVGMSTEREDDPRRGLGVGKTHLAIAALRAHGDGWFWKTADILEDLRQRAFDDYEKVRLSDMLREYREENRLLVLDDLGTEKRTEWAAEQLYRILDSRSDAKLPTIITSNVGLVGIDARIQDRYREGLEVCKGKSLRGREDLR